MVDTRSQMEMTAPTPSPPSAESSPPSSPSPPIRYFDLLPPELLRHILRQIDAAPYKDRRERQATLYSLSLCSKLLHELAQPLLLKRIFSFYGKKQGNLAALVGHNSTDSLANVQTLRLTVYPSGSAFFEKAFEELVRKAIGLQDVYIHGEHHAVQILRGTTTTTLSLHRANLDQITGHSSLVGHICLPQLVNLSLYACGRLEVSQFSVPKLKHLALISSPGRNQPFSSEEALFLDQVASTLVSLTIDLESFASLPPSIFSSSISLLLRIELYASVPSTLPRSGSILFTLPDAKINYPQEDSASDIANLRKWTNLISTSDHQPEAVYLALYYEGGGGGDKVHPALQDAVNNLVVTCQQQGMPTFWEEEDVYGYTFADFVPAPFIKRSEARYAEAQRV